MGSNVKQKTRGPGRPKDEILRARRQSEIITHAIAEFARSGYANADLEAIAANAGCSKGTLYHYFPSKEQLFNASLDHVMLSIGPAAGVDEAADPLDQLEQLVHGFLRHFADYPQHVELLIQERSDFRDREKSTYVQYRTASRKQWETRFKRLMAEGRMRRMPPEQALEFLGNLIYGAVFLNYFRHRQIKPEQQARELLDVLFGGLLTEAEFLSRNKSR